MRIGLFGGTFNPPHLGHLLLAQAALEDANLERITFIPCGNPPHKDNAEIADAEKRLKMVKLLIQGDERFCVSDMEVRSDSPSYTARTLEKLQKVYPDDTLCFIMGADSLCEMEDWYHPELIFQRAEIIVALRGGYDNSKVDAAINEYKKKYNAVITPIYMPQIEISASDIRDRLKNGKSVRYMLPSSIIQYIEQNNIYGV